MNIMLRLIPCLMVVWADFAFAQDCISLKKIEESRVETIEKAHQIESGSWFKEYIWDKSKFSAAYTYGSKRSFEDPNGKTWKDNSEHKGEMKLIYEIPLNIRYQNQKKLDFLHKSFFNQFNCLSFTQSKLYMPASKLNRRFNLLRRFLYTQDKILKHFILPNTCST
ncbi:hypothetical protein [Acinetobacter haemolyticus]|uniref:hypothetical protein n=1 Tax=Acinetobacter haemolyticus TaxID=29430 RepID=UPI001D0DFBB4|nr:hypothetical protein [Acinetobacter haemolyticus]